MTGLIFIVQKKESIYDNFVVYLCFLLLCTLWLNILPLSNKGKHEEHKAKIVKMKLRIKGNSIRIRLTKTEVSTIATTGYLEEETIFGNNRFVYALQRIDEGNALTASLEQNKITVFVPALLTNDWPANNIVGFEANMPVADNKTLYLLLEKDFICLDETTEDQSDNYENPNKSC